MMRSKTVVQNSSPGSRQGFGYLSAPSTPRLTHNRAAAAIAALCLSAGLVVSLTMLSIHVVNAIV
ncbi:hypothetical protein OCAR_7176 [Afipia carboxidovorans OM5]|nr:hypothetical protein [Afipia carboxidovorans]ACI94280.1 hypothetical protein OCAR_7176 [Afipia carboxidovorans OM5]BEV46421.1 hypothetical protein CRBSH125_26040 [Afipia carboxidovorans]